MNRDAKTNTPYYNKNIRDAHNHELTNCSQLRVADDKAQHSDK